MLPRLLFALICSLLWFGAALTARAQELLPFGSDILPKFTFSESYTDTVVLGEFGYEQVPVSALVVEALASTKQIGLEDLAAEDSMLSVTAGNLQLDLALTDATHTVVNGRQTYTWELESTDFSTGELFTAGTVTLSFDQKNLTMRVEVNNASTDYSVYATEEAGLEDELADFPVISAFSVGPYGFSDTTLYVTGKATVSDKTVGSGADQEVFFNLARVRLSGGIDTSYPIVSFEYPARDAVTERPITVTGTYSDVHGIYSVELSLNGGTFILADLTDGKWAVPFVDLAVGKNTLTVRCTDQDGHVSTKTRTCTFTLMSPLTVTAAGDASGRVTSAFFPALSYSPTAAAPSSVTKHSDGVRLTITAVPGAGAVFNGWTSNNTLTEKQMASPVLTFRHQPNMALTAHFLVNPFTPVKGTYHGLATGAQPEGNGFLALRLANDGSFTGSLRVGTVQVPLKGRFSNTGRFTRAIKVKGVTYNVDLTLNVSGTGAQQITGTANGGNVNVTIQSNRGAFNSLNNAAPQAGTYNVIIPPDPVQSGLYPLGIGYGRIAVGKSGVARFSGRLASGPAFNAGAQLSAAGEWPFYGALYSRRGSITGLVRFNSSDPAHDLSGALAWFKPANVPLIAAYPEGFTGRSAILGAKFLPPLAGQRLFLEASSGAGLCTLAARENAPLGEMNVSVNASVSTVQALSFVLPSDAPIQNLLAKINPLTGIFTGTFLEGQTLRRFRGAIVGTKLNRAAGFFTRGPRSGSIEIVAAGP